jgi:hypothetical protein
MSKTSTLPAPVQGYLDASNAFGGDALIAWFAGDALVNDRREFWGKDAIRAWPGREILGGKVTTRPAGAAGQYGEVIVHAVTGGEYDKTGLPGPARAHLLLHRPRRSHRAADHHPQRADAGVGPAMRDIPGRKDRPYR